jgi:hypothetical protein
MKREILEKAKACSGPCEKCANNRVVFGSPGKQCKFGSMGPVADEFVEGKTPSNAVYSKNVDLLDR